MTREEALKWFEKNIRSVSMPGARAAHEAAISALRSISREQVEKVWKGCAGCNDRRCASCRCFGWQPEVCKQCENQSNYQPLKFCPHCGKPLRNEAVQMVMERLEALR